MKFKIDENLPEELSELLRQHGYDAHSIIAQNLSGRPDAHVALVCQQENRCLITLDLDFADIRTYPPQDYPGLMVLRPHTESIKSVLVLMSQVLPLLSTQKLVQHLWIVEPHGLRIRSAGS